MVSASHGILSDTSLITMMANLANKLTSRLGEWHVGSWLGSLSVKCIERVPQHLNALHQV